MGVNERAAQQQVVRSTLHVALKRSTTRKRETTPPRAARVHARRYPHPTLLPRPIINLTAGDDHCYNRPVSFSAHTSLRTGCLLPKHTSDGTGNIATGKSAHLRKLQSEPDFAAVLEENNKKRRARANDRLTLLHSPHPSAPPGRTNNGLASSPKLRRDYCFFP